MKNEQSNELVLRLVVRKIRYMTGGWSCTYIFLFYHIKKTPWDTRLLQINILLLPTSASVMVPSEQKEKITVQALISAKQCI